MKILEEHLNRFCAHLLIENYKLMYCLEHYDELLRELNDEIDNCNYFGEELCLENILR